MTRKPNVKRPSNKQVMGKLDRISRELCHYRHGWKCVRCQGTSDLHWAHIVPRFGHKVIRWADYNSITLCQTCHKWYDTKATARQQYRLIDSINPLAFDQLEAVDAHGVPLNEKVSDLTIDGMVALAEQLKEELNEWRKLDDNTTIFNQNS